MKLKQVLLIATVVFSGICFVGMTPYDCSAQVFDRDYSAPPDSLFRGSLGLFSDREFRGQNLYNGTSIQPALKAGMGTGFGLLYVDLFGHISADNNTSPATQEYFNEFDFALGHTFDFQEIQLGVGHRWYSYSRTSDRLTDTSEVFIELTSVVIANPHFTAAYDNDEHKGWFYEFGLHQPIPLGLNNERDAIVPSVTLGISSSLDDGAHPIYDENGIAFVDIGLKGVFGLVEGVTLEPSMHYNEKVDDATSSDFIFGVNIVGSTSDR